MSVGLCGSLRSAGLSGPQAERLTASVAVLCREMTAPLAWRTAVETVLPEFRDFAVHSAVHEAIFRSWPATAGSPPAWVPPDDVLDRANLGILMRDLGVTDYTELHQWSVRHRDAFWERIVRHLGIRFEQPPHAVRSNGNVSTPTWLPGARMNIAASCFQADEDRAAVVYQKPGQELRSVTYGDLDRLSNRVANSLRHAGFRLGDAVGLAMPMHPESVAVYLGIIKAGCTVVAVSEQFSAEEIGRRLSIGGVAGVFVQELRVRRTEVLYSKLKSACAPRAVVMPEEGGESVGELRAGDVAWSDFLTGAPTSVRVAVSPETFSHVLFSSGTTRDPKAIPWTHTTPIRGVADAWLHHDIQPGDVLVWPTSLAWMMGPWLVYAALINRATIGIYGGPPTTKGFGAFVQDCGATMLGVVPTLVGSWRSTRCMEAFDWTRIRCFSSTGECSNAENMMYLMWLAGWKPVIEYCGGTEIGGGYMTGTMVQPAVPGTFSTPALGIDVVILDEEGESTHNGELFLVPPSIGLSNTLLNYDHDEVYFKGTPPGPGGERLRRHGDRMERLPGGYFRSHGRVDDTMNLKGIKASSAELERIFDSLEGLQESAAIAVPPPGGGPGQLVVYVVLEPGVDLASGQLRLLLGKALREKHGSLFRVHEVVVVDALPRTASNKVMRRQLREAYRNRRGVQA